MKRRNLVPEVTILDTECYHYDSIVGCLISTNVKCAFCPNFIDKDSLDIFQLATKHISIMREKILGLQHGNCSICGKQIDIKDACLDHHHQKKNKGTGLIRGVLDRTCNSMLAKNENNATRYRVGQGQLPDVLRNMADYLEARQYPYMHPSEKPKIKKLKKDSYNRLVKVMKLAKEKKIPEYSSTGKLTIALDAAYKKYGMTPEYYK